MDETPDKRIAEAIATSQTVPDRDTAFAARIEKAAQRRHRRKALIQVATAGSILVAGGGLATLAFDLVTNSLATLGAPSPASTVLLTALGVFGALVFKEFAQFVLQQRRR